MTLTLFLSTLRLNVYDGISQLMCLQYFKRHATRDSMQVKATVCILR